jgi:two-component system capsular synthesis response regulator RcsB
MLTPSLNQRLRVALLDDHAAILHGLTARLAQERDIDIVGAFSGSQEMINVLQSAPADFLLIDYALGHNDIDGHNLIRLLRIRFPKAKIIVTSAHDNQATVTLAIQAGASGFVGKGQDLDDLVTAIRTVARGDTYLPPEVAAELDSRGEIKPSARKNRPAIANSAFAAMPNSFKYIINWTASNAPARPRLLVRAVPSLQPRRMALAGGKSLPGGAVAALALRAGHGGRTVPVRLQGNVLDQSASGGADRGRSLFAAARIHRGRSL